MNRKMKQKMNETSRVPSYVRHLPPCPFVLSYSPANETVAVRKQGLLGAPRWETTFVDLQIELSAAYTKVFRRAMEEALAVFNSRQFVREWAGFVRSVLENGKMTEASWSRLRTKRTEQWFRRFCKKWGIHQMNGWKPEVKQGNCILNRMVVYRCENCGQRHESQPVLLSVPYFWGPPPIDWESLDKEMSFFADCCKNPCLIPIRTRLLIDTYPDITIREWAVFHRLTFAKIDPWTGRSLPTDLRRKQKVRGSPWRTGRKEFIAELKTEAQTIFPKVRAMVQKLGVQEIISVNIEFRNFWKKDLGKGHLPPYASTHINTVTYALVGANLKKKHHEEFKKFKFRFDSIRKIRDYVKSG